MFDVELHCPHCKNVLGKANGSDNTGYAKVLKSPPKTEPAKQRTFENKCPKCNRLVYIILGFKD